MSPGKLIRRFANLILRPLRWELVKSPRLKHARFTIDDGLLRTAERVSCIGTIVDVGASDGRWSKMALLRFPDAHVLAFEPLEERRSKLDACKLAHEKFDYVLAAAGADEVEVNLHVTDDLDGSGIREQPGDCSRVVPVTTIDKEVQRRNLPGPYLVKLDTHGFELPILEGAKHTLKSTAVVIIEVYNFQAGDFGLRFHEMCSHMESIGFRCYDLVDPMLRPKDKALWQMDLFFAPADQPMFQYGGYC